MWRQRCDVHAPPCRPADRLMCVGGVGRGGGLHHASCAARTPSLPCCPACGPLHLRVHYYAPCTLYGCMV